MLNQNTNSHRKILIIITFAIILSFALFARGGTTTVSENLDKGITCKKGEWAKSPLFTGDSSGCPDLIEYVFKPSFINERASELNVRFYTLPAGAYGYALVNSGFVSDPYFTDVDSTDTKRIDNSYGTTTKGLTLRIKMTKENALFYYPFDRYQGEVKTQSIDKLTKSRIPGIAKVSVSSLAGWKLDLFENEDLEANKGEKIIYNNGVVTLNWKLARASVVYLAVSILLILMLIALFSAYAITRSISNLKRPPSMNLLLWLATVLFAILQVRFNFPGNPPIGILIDYIVVFPVLGLLLIFGIANTFYWLRRNDWDYENEILIQSQE